MSHPTIRIGTERVVCIVVAVVAGQKLHVAANCIPRNWHMNGTWYNVFKKRKLPRKGMG